MLEIQIISHRGHSAAIVAGDSAIVAQHVPGDLVAHVQAKALYAMQIQAGELPGPYTDAGAERYAHTAAATAAPPAPRERPADRGATPTVDERSQAPVRASQQRVAPTTPPYGAT